MSDNILEIPLSQIQDDNPLPAQILVGAFNAVSTWANLEVRNRRQILLDCFRSGYTTDNDGNANYTKSLENQMEFPLRSYLHYDFQDTAGDLSATIYNNIYWLGAGSNCTITIADAVNGILQLATTSAGVADPSVTYRFSSFDVTLNPVMEAMLKVSAITTAEMYVGWRSIANPSNDYVCFKFNSATSATNLYAASRNNGGAEVFDDTLIDLSAGTNIKYRVEITNTSNLRFYINDIEVCHGFTGTIRSLTDWVPFVKLTNKVNEVRTLSLDYIRTMQNRAA